MQADPAIHIRGQNWQRHAAQLEEANSLNYWAAICCGIVLAVLYGYMVGGGLVEPLILTTVGLTAGLVIIFVRDYWWAPLLLVTALTFQVLALGFSMTGLEIGIVILALTLPVKLALRTLTLAQPRLRPGFIFLLLLFYVVLHAVIIYYYSQIDGAPQMKNIVKAYYKALSPLLVFWLLSRYCHTRTVKPVMMMLLIIYFCIVSVAIPVILLGIQIPALSTLRIHVDWADVESAVGSQRTNGPLLLWGAMALRPAARGPFVRWFLTLSIILAILGTGVGAGRTAMGMSIIGVLVLFVIQKNFSQLLIGIVSVVLLSLTISSFPEILDRLPYTIHRSLIPLNFSERVTSVGETVTSSDQWHHELRKESIPYWTQDLTSFLFGHGFKSWDDSFNFRGDYGADYELAKKVAIQMGGTENAFSAITNIFGLTGLILYLLFFATLARQLWRGRQLAPPRSYARGICEFSLVSLITSLIFLAYNGGVPGVAILFFQLGVLAARPYLAAGQPARRDSETGLHPETDSPGLARNI